MPKGIKKSVKILIISAASFILLLASPFILLQFNKIQNLVVDVITRDLSASLDTKIEIGRVNYHFFNKLKIENIYIEDQQQDTLLQIDKVYAGFDFWRLFKKKIAFSNLEIERFYANIKTDASGKTNFEFLFKKNKTDQDAPFIDLRLEQLKITDSKVYYIKTTDSLDFQHTKTRRMVIEDINSSISINTLTNDSINASVKYLNAIGGSGFILKNLTATITGSPERISFPTFSISFPESQINLNNLLLSIDSSENKISLANKLSVSIPVHNAEISLADLRSIVPEFTDIHETVRLNALITGKLASLRFRDVRLSYGKSTMDAQLDINGLPNIQESFIYGQINHLQVSIYEIQDFISKINKKPFLLPKELHRLGQISYNGNITGFLSDLVAYGNFNTNAGSISSDISLRFENNLTDLSYNGTLKTNGLSVGKILNDTAFGIIAIDLNTKGIKKHNQPIRGTIKGKLSELEFNAYTYKNADFDGTYDGTGFNGKINIKDDNIEAGFLGIIDFKNPEIPVFDFDLTINNTNLHALKIIKNYPDARLSFHGKTNISGSNLDNLNGNLILKDIVFTNQNQTLNAKDIIFTSRTGDDYTYFSIESDYLNGSFSGDFKYSSIGHTFNKILSAYLPSLSENGNTIQHLPNTIAINLTIENTREISQILALPYEIDGHSSIKGNINENSSEIQVLLKMDALKTEKQIFENISLRLENESDKIQFTGRTQMHDKKSGLLNIFLSTEAFRDMVNAKLIWQNNEEVTNAGEISTNTSLHKKNKSIQAHTTLQPSQVIISDSVWNIRKSDIQLYSDSLITINNFLFENEKQYIHINGKASKNSQDSLVVSMNELNLDYIMQLLRLKGIKFGGLVTGKLKLFSLLKEPIYLANLDVKDFSLNDKIIADALVSSTWDKENRQLLINGDFTNKNKEQVAKAIGVFVPRNDSLDLQIDARKFPLEFLNRYFEGVASNFNGDGAGMLRIFGPTKTLLFEGDIAVTNGRASIDLLNTTYHFNDRVKLTPYRIHLNNIKLIDEEKNNATLNGFIDHNGSFADMVYDVSINAKNILAMHTTSADDDFFYGKAYMGGLVRIHGNDNEANIIVNGVSRPRTKCYMSMGGSSSVLENDFIRFAEKRIYQYIDEKQEEKKKEFVNQTPFNVKVDMQIEVTPEAEMEIIVDPRAGDKITGRGRGNVRIRFDTFSDVELYGTIELDQGYYLFTLQTVIRKEFKINNGSTISWAGNPFEAEVNITGYYPLTASLADLIESDELKQITTRSTVPVHCLLHLTEDLMSPAIKFDIDLPASDESVKSRVKNIINTEEMMNRQILYLMLFHKFFTPDNMRTSAVGINEGISFAVASASAQLNNYIQGILNSNVFSLGIDWQKTDVESDEVKAQILIQPNNRLVINGNIGYRNDNISENKFIGDFDLEYKLVESGRLRFTAYNHTIDRAQLREAKTTQGVGLIYREDFNTVPEMFVYYWGVVKGLFTKKNK
ncbi:MAG: hypothetical protein PHQ11_02795 [Paludibacter sp.]|nr:hypothetical protein [Paludibacter sp.]MDD4198174.1 hypothetical protein [Paludibacter sp.]MDD4426878.1 hypothetical protein [Paludibacter sp.]